MSVTSPNKGLRNIEGRLIDVLADWCPDIQAYHLYHPSRREIDLKFAAADLRLAPKTSQAALAAPPPFSRALRQSGGRNIGSPSFVLVIRRIAVEIPTSNRTTVLRHCSPHSSRPSFEGAHTKRRLG